MPIGGMRAVRTGALFVLAACACFPASTWYVTVAGLGGEPDYEQRFASWAQEIEKLVKSGAGQDARIQTLAGGEATREKLRTALERIVKEASPQDSVALMLIGHGSFDGVDYKINLPGPDISAAEIASVLNRVPASRQAVINMTSASGASLDTLQRENRAVITATKAGSEKNATVFARYWVEALRDPAADTDKNQVISLLEAYRYADRKTVQFYETQKRLATEHAVLEDTGRGEGVRAPSPENGQGLAAAQFALLRLDSAQLAANDPEKRKLLAKKEELEQAIDRLKYEKAALPTDQYRKRLSALLLELARTQEELEK